MRYQRVTNEADLLEGLAQPGAVILCGGTDVIVKMRAGLLAPSILLDVTQIESLHSIRAIGEVLEIGAASLESDILRSPLVHQHVPLLAAALKQLGSVQIRNRGTLAGNIVNASPAADGAIPLLLYDAEVQLVGPAQTRWVRLDDFFTGPGKTVLASNEFIRTLRMPLGADGFQPFFHKVGKRNALTIAIASLGLLLRVQEGTIKDVRIAVGSVAPTPRRLPKIESQLTGRVLDDALVLEARDYIVSAIAPISDVRASADYRRNVIGDLFARALQSHVAKPR